MFRLFAATFAAALLVSPAASAAGGPQGPSSAVPPVTGASINDAAPNGANDQDPSLIAKAETLLDRAHFSPGAIDGLDGDNFRRAIRAFQEVNGLAVTGNLDAVRGEPDKLKAVVVRLPVDQHEVGPDVAIAVIPPLADTRVVAKTLRQRLFGRKHFHDIHKQFF